MTSNKYCWLKRIKPDKGVTCQKEKCFTLSRMIEEATAAEIEANSAKAVVAGRPKGRIPTNGKRKIIVPESTEEGGVITPDHPGVTTHLNVGTLENMAIMKRSAGKRRVTPELHHEGDYGCMRSMPVWETTPTSISEGVAYEQRYPDVVHSDVWGLAQVSTLGGCRYYVTFIDDFSRPT